MEAINNSFKENRMEKKSIFLYNRKRATMALVSSIVMAILVFIGLMMRLFDNEAVSGYNGTEAYRLFTIDSNCLVGICALLAIPYQVDGIRTGNYHMPKWIVYTLYVGVTAVAMTFVISVCILAPVAGFKEMLLTRSNLFFHVLNPIVSICLFMFVACDHKVNFKATWIAMTPVFIYAAVYIVMVFIIGEAHGGWIDHYKFNYYIPWPITLVVMLGFVFGIATGLRAVHNAMHKKEKDTIKKDYQEMLGAYASIEEAVKALAMDDKSRDPHNNDVTVPRRVISMIMECYESDKSCEDLCNLYISTYLEQ